MPPENESPEERDVLADAERAYEEAQPIFDGADKVIGLLERQLDTNNWREKVSQLFRGAA